MALLLYAIWNDIADSCGYDKKSTFRYYGFGGILLSLMMGGAMIPYKSWQLGLASTWPQVTGGNINLGLMFLITGICGTLIITAYVLLGARLFKVDFSTMEAFDVEKLGEESKHLRPRTKRILVVYLIIMLLAIFSGTFLNNPLSDFLNNTLTAGGLYCVCSALLMVIPSGEGDGQAAIHFNDIKHSDSAVSWPVILMCAVTIPLATALTNESTGVLPWLTGIFSPIFEGRSPVFILVFTIIVMLILTNVGSNIAFGGAMIPVVSPFVIASGMNPVVAGAALIWMANMGLVLPGASAPRLHFPRPQRDSRRRTAHQNCALLRRVAPDHIHCGVLSGLSGYGLTPAPPCGPGASRQRAGSAHSCLPLIPYQHLRSVPLPTQTKEMSLL